MKHKGGFLQRIIDIFKPSDAGTRSASSSKMETPTEQSEPSGTLALGLRLFGELEEPNAVLSAVGVHLALQLAALGATDDSTNASELRAALGRYTASAPDSDGPLTTATAVFAADSVSPALITAAERLGAHAAPLPSAVGPVNEWVSTATKGEISTILDSLPPATEAVLLSAVHFAAPWKHAFDPTDTEDAYFYPSPDKQTAARMMTLSNKRLPYAESTIGGGKVQALELPYAPGCSGLVLLPEAGGLDALVQALGEDGGAGEMMRLRAAMKTVEVGAVGLPRFRVEAGANLNEALRKAGVKAAFDGEEGGPFGKLSDRPGTVLADVVHKASLECTEEGTVAAAATAMVMVRCAMVSDKPEVVCDRPFLFAVVEGEELLFICRVDDVVAPVDKGSAEDVVKC